MKYLSMIAITMIMFVSAGCEMNDGGAEKMGENIDNAITDTGNAIEDACENVKEGVNAKDQDC